MFLPFEESSIIVMETNEFGEASNWVERVSHELGQAL